MHSIGLHGNFAIDTNTLRKLQELAESPHSVTWEEIDDKGLFTMFSRIPTKRELKRIVTECTPRQQAQAVGAGLGS